MPDSVIYEYATIRLVPIVEREEFINIGVIIYSRKSNLLIMQTTLDASRILAFNEEVDINKIKTYLSSWELICKGEGGGIGDLEMHVRFRWLTANRSTIIQCSAVHPGFCTDPLVVLAKLHARFVS